MISRKKIFVTGASGFLGAHLCQSLKNRNIECIGFSRKHGPMVDVVINNYRELISFYEQNSILVNLAGDNRGANSTEEEMVSELSEIYKNNMVFISSSNVYGLYNNEKVSEDMTFKHNDDYAVSKISLEQVVLNNRGLVLRLSNVYGKGMSQNKIFYDIYNQINSSNTHIKLRNINVIKDYLYIDDFCDAIHLILDKPLKNTIINLGSGIGEKSIDLIKIICKILNKDFSKVKILSEESTSIKNILNIDLFMKEYNWTARTNIENGIYKWIKS